MGPVGAAGFNSVVALAVAVKGVHALILSLW
jgi:hypothetical protein